jgi:hypothetical protein
VGFQLDPESIEPGDRYTVHVGPTTITGPIQAVTAPKSQWPLLHFETDRWRAPITVRFTRGDDILLKAKERVTEDLEVQGG